LGATSWTWDFGNGAKDTASKPDQVYSNVGIFNVKLKVQNAAGCMDSLVKSITIDAKPTPRFTILPKGGSSYSFATLDSSLSTSSYRWSLGDSTILTGYSFRHTYAGAATYPVRLTMTQNGCSAIKDTTLSVLTASFTSHLTNIHLNIYPNPFKVAATISYHLPYMMYFDLSIKDLFGCPVAQLQKGLHKSGSYAQTISAEALGLKAGLYFLVFKAGSYTAIRKIIME
jgi:PKD repeat protein